MMLVELIKKHHTDWSSDHFTANNYENARLLVSNYKTRNQSSWDIVRSQKKAKAPNGTVGVGYLLCIPVPHLVPKTKRRAHRCVVFGAKIAAGTANHPMQSKLII